MDRKDSERALKAMSDAELRIAFPDYFRHKNGHATHQAESRIEPINDPGEKNSETQHDAEPTAEAAALALVMHSPTEDNVALLFEQRFAGLLRYCKLWGFWLQWDGARWRPEHTDLAFDFCRRIARSVNVNGKATIAKRSFSSGVEAYTRAARVFATLPDQWDPDDFALNMPKGNENISEGGQTP